MYPAYFLKSRFFTMMNIKKVLTSSALALVLFTFGVKPVVAEQYGQYGGVGEVKNIALDKKVKHPRETTKDGQEVYVDNLFVSDYLFKSDEQVKFKVTITNISNQDLKIKVKDILPKDYLFTYDSLDFVINANTQDLEKEIELKADESKDLYFVTKVVSQDKLPQTGSYYCTLNTAQAWIDGENVVYQDQAQICVAVEAVTKGGVPFILERLPEAGPVENLAVLLGSAVLSLAGFKLVKKKK